MVRVLVVEDEANIREMIALNLRLAGMEAVEAESAEAALPLLEKKPGCDAAGHERLLPVRDHPPHRSEDRHYHPQRQGTGAGQDPRPFYWCR